MSIEDGPKQVNQESESLKIESHIEPQNEDSKESVAHDLEKEQAKAKERDEIKIAEIRSSLNLEQGEEQKEIKQYLQEYLDLKENDIEKVSLLKAKNLPEKHQTQREVFHDERLDGINVVVVPDDLWVKGNQPSESSAENKLISIKQSYFEEQENPDEIAWICHELAHCKNFLDSKSPEEYQNNMQTFAFEDLKTEYTYPNNKVEQYTFTKQFQYLKELGKNREDILEMIEKYYDKEDMPFFNKVLDGIYEK